MCWNMSASLARWSCAQRRYQLRLNALEINLNCCQAVFQEKGVKKKGGLSMKVKVKDIVDVLWLFIYPFVMC